MSVLALFLKGWAYRASLIPRPFQGKLPDA
jgi:hypothetical protein